MRYEKVHVCIDDRKIAEGDPSDVIEPVWWSANIYDGPEPYELSLLQFTRSQRLVFAVLWYAAEVNNGGHRQFYSNSTGIVWKDALEALRVLDMPEFADVLERSAELLGGTPSLGREERSEQLNVFQPDFEELDERFYELDRDDELNARLIRFIRSRPADFYFDGTITRVVLPGR
jgi:hypothetical protein